jgi:4-aminobutyrate aminotransferase-like enzyme/Ser/Thr protein kinase RdoA (MazF antagonist)
MSDSTDRPEAPRRPSLTPQGAVLLAKAHWGLSCEAASLPGDRDLNFKLTGERGDFVLKVTDASAEEVSLSAAALSRLSGCEGGLSIGLAVPDSDGGLSRAVKCEDGRTHRAWLVKWVDGVPLAHAGPKAHGLLKELGRKLGSARVSLAGFEHPGLDRDLKWDLRRGLEVASVNEVNIGRSVDRRVVRETLAGVGVNMGSRAAALRVGVIHGDANDHNLLVKDTFPASGACGLLDVGDIDRSWILAECAIASAYLMLEESDPLAALEQFVAGYHEADPIPEEELDLLFDLARLRLCVSVCISAEQSVLEPENEYLSVTTEPALRLLRSLLRVDSAEVNERLFSACGYAFAKKTPLSVGRLGSRRAARFGSNLSLSYAEPLEIIRGEGRYLIDAGGRAYLDCVNNVTHVGHCHPDVLDAATAQMETLNTNTRYLSDVRMRFAERLVSTLPDGLDVVYLVNSGSEANELAMRLAMAHTGGDSWVVLESAYHGNTDALVALSPYKFRGPGGKGQASNVSVAALPDRFRGEWGYDEAAAGELYAGDVRRCVVERAAAPGSLAGFFAESISGCGGQVVFPDGYLASAYAHVRAAGGVAIADEVQVGCGRVGSHWWAFETQGVVPDIVTIGKPLGNGHPIGAVVTTKEIAASFDSGMEFFNTFGGNPVSCATADAVLRVVEDEGLRLNARAAGEALLEGLRGLAASCPRIGDVRGIGLFVGVVFVTDAASRQPDEALATSVVEGAKRRGVLLSTDGPLHDVVKIKPPMVFLPEDADHLVSVIREALLEATAEDDA